RSPLSLHDALPILDRRLRLDRDRNMPRSVRAPPSLRQRAERNLALARERRNRDTAAVRVVNRAMHVPVHQNLNSLEIPGERRTSPKHALPRRMDQTRISLSIQTSRGRGDRATHRTRRISAVRLLPQRDRQIPVRVINRHPMIVQRRIRELRHRLQMAEAATIVRELPCETAQVRGVRGGHYRAPYTFTTVKAAVDKSSRGRVISITRTI